MTLQLFAHPFSSYSLKALIGFYETGAPFTLRRLSSDDPATASEFAALWPLQRFPILRDGARTIVEATSIIEHLAVHHGAGASLIPRDPDAAVEVRMMDRVFDNYVHVPQSKCVFDFVRAPEARDAQGVAEARALLDQAYAWLDGRMAGRQWAVGDEFSLADCAAAPALLYGNWTHPIDARFVDLLAYRRRLLARPSVARAVDEGRPYRSYFPLGAPDRD
jgi:glutathione S-transferase